MSSVSPSPLASVAPQGEARPWRDLPRRKSRRVMVGNVPIGDGAPIAVQSMLNAPAEDLGAARAQMASLEDAGAELVRVSCPTEDSTRALRDLVRAAKVPLIADIHFHHQRAIEAADAGAACLRINPGNIGNQARTAEVIAAARANGCAIRIGVNAGSLERDLLERYRSPTPEAMVESALRHIAILQEHNFDAYKVSLKASDVFMTFAATRLLAAQSDCPLHIGITEAGGAYAGVVKSAIGLGHLLWAGIGDTLRVSLSAPPEDEIQAGFEILKSLGLRHRGVTIVSCPSCARQGFDVIAIVRQLEERLAHVREPMTLAIMGCVVNGPGEAREADFGFTGGGAGRGGAGQGRVYLAGQLDTKLSNDQIVEHFVNLVERKAAAVRRDVSPPATPKC